MLKIKSYVRAYRYTYCDNVCKRMTGYGYRDYLENTLLKVFIWRDPITKIWYCSDESSGITIKTFDKYVDVVEFVSSDKLYNWYRKMIKSRKYANSVKKFKETVLKLERKKGETK